jgi:hypothetical protein
MSHERNTEKEKNGYVVFINEISTDQLGNRVLGEGDVLRPSTRHLEAFRIDIKTT